MSMRRLFFGFMAAAVGIVATAASATDDPIQTRRKLMQANGAAFYGVAQGIIKGEIPFNPVVAASVIRTTNAVAYSFGDYFRSEERRVGKECRSRWSTENWKREMRVRCDVGAV